MPVFNIGVLRPREDVDGKTSHVHIALICYRTCDNHHDVNKELLPAL